MKTDRIDQIIYQQDSNRREGKSEFKEKALHESASNC